MWRGFTGGGHYALRLWTLHPKMQKADWEAHVPAVKRAVDIAEARAPERTAKRAKVWHDNEKFLLCPDTYRRSGLVQVPERIRTLGRRPATWQESSCTGHY